jgi:exopolysaccharide biosynthesis polyprenyl glycosylphosphotransferase
LGSGETDVLARSSGRFAEDALERHLEGPPRSRGWLVRRALLAADLVGLTLAFGLSLALFGGGDDSDRLAPLSEFLIFFAALPVFVLIVKLYGLYDQDEERADHSTIDECAGVLNCVTLGAWTVFVASWFTGMVSLNAPRIISFWVFACAFVMLARATARTLCRHSVSYLQNTVIVGAGEVGQLVARKVLQHPEYGINLVGFVDREPKERRGDLGHLTVIGVPEDLPELVSLLDVDRVIIAFSNESEKETLRIVRSLRDVEVQVDVVPRLFEIVGLKVGMHNVEGLPLVGLPPARLSPSSRFLKRAIDVVGSLALLTVTAPLFLYIAIRIKLDSPGPVFFKQVRLGLNMREFNVLKFRTMTVDTDESVHRDYVRSTMASNASVGQTGLYKLDREKEITGFGRKLRTTSLDELPQLVNVLRGEMSLVGPRPCIPYETELFEEHHFERFLVPAGITGLWQVMARARTTFGEALDMDVAYARGWSVALDLRLLFRTPLQLLRGRGTI